MVNCQIYSVVDQIEHQLHVPNTTVMVYCPAVVNNFFGSQLPDKVTLK